MDEPDPPASTHLWLLPWLMPLVIVAVVVGGGLLPLWLFLVIAVGVLIVGVPLAWRAYADGRGAIELPSWLPGSKPGNR